MIAEPSHIRFNKIGSTRCNTDCTPTWSPFNGSPTDAVHTACGSSPDNCHFAFLTGAATGATSIDQIQSQIKTSTLPIFRAPIDSGCTASCTDTLARLVNIRRCDEEFKAANGYKCKCDTIGDMPVLAKDSTGKIFRFVFTNVRYVPGFEYTLFSVRQMIREQRIKPSFADREE